MREAGPIRSGAAELPRLTARSFLRRLLTPAATGWGVWVVSYLLFLVDDLPIFGADQGAGWPAIEQWARSAFLTTLGHMGLGVVLLLARVSWLRSSVARRRSGVVVTTFVIAALVSTTIEVIVGSLSSADAVLISADSLVYHLSALVVVAVTVSAIADQQRMLGVLLQRRRELEFARTEGEVALSRLRTEVVELFRQQFLESGREVHHAPELVRRITRELAFSDVDVARAVTPGKTRPSIRSMWAAVAVRPLLAPGLMATVMTLLAFRSTTVTVGDSSVTPPMPGAGLALTVDADRMGRSILMIAAVWAATYLATRLVARAIVEAGHRARWPLSWWMHALAVIGAALLAQALASLVYLFPGYSAPPPFEPWMLGAYVIPVLGCSVVIGIVRAVDRHAALTRDAVSSVISRLEWDVARLNARARGERRSLAFLLHGTVLRALHLATLRSDGVSSTEVSLDELFDIALGALQGDGAEQRRGLRERLEGVALLWQNVSDIRLSVDDDTSLALAGDPSSTSAIVDVVSEAVTNSVMHAHARRVSVDIRLSDIDLVEIVVEDEAAPPDHEAESVAGGPGLGSRLFDELCVLWHRYPASSGSRFQAWVPAEGPQDLDPEDLEGQSARLLH